MDPISPITTSNAAPPRGASDQDSGITADFETFLTLLTAQMRHQDPLNPADSTEFTAQLATFSGVEQQVRTNDLLTDIQAGFATLGLGELTGWIGMDLRAEMPVQFNGAPVEIAPNTHPFADRAELIVRDGGDEIVQRVQIPLGDGPITWSGLDSTGQTQLPDGVYHLSVESWSGEQMLDERPVATYATVQEAVMRDGEVWLTLADGRAVAASSVQGLRAPQP